MVDEEFLDSVLIGTPKLKELTCQLTYVWHDNEVCCRDLLAAALGHVRKSLVSLKLCFHICYRGIEEDLFDQDGNWRDEIVDEPWNVFGKIGSMKHFKQLRLVVSPISVWDNF